MSPRNKLILCGVTLALDAFLLYRAWGRFRDALDDVLYGGPDDLLEGLSDSPELMVIDGTVWMPVGHVDEEENDAFFPPSSHHLN